MEDLIGIALRISVMYLYALAILRLSGKRSFGNLSALDFLLTTVIGDMFDDVFWAEVPLSQGIVGVTTIVFWHMLVAFASYHSKSIHFLVSARETPLIQKGDFVRENLRAERMREGSVLSELRIQAEDKLKEVEQANLEPSGQLSLLKRQRAKPAQKRDLPQLKELLR